MAQQQPVSNYKSFIKVITLIHLAIMAGLIMMTVVLTMGSDGLGPLSFTQQLKEFIIPIALIGAIALGRFMNTSMLSTLDTKDRLQKKLTTYQTAHIIKIASIEGVGLFSVVTYSNTNNSFFLVIAALALALLITLFPTKEKIENAIPTNSEDQVYLRNPEKVFGS